MSKQFECLFTPHITQKRKKWMDGQLNIDLNTKKIRLLDDESRVVSVDYFGADPLKIKEDALIRVGRFLVEINQLLKEETKRNHNPPAQRPVRHGVTVVPMGMPLDALLKQASPPPPPPPPAPAPAPPVKRTVSERESVFPEETTKNVFQTPIKQTTVFFENDMFVSESSDLEMSPLFNKSVSKRSNSIQSVPPNFTNQFEPQPLPQPQPQIGQPPRQPPPQLSLKVSPSPKKVPQQAPQPPSPLPTPSPQFSPQLSPVLSHSPPQSLPQSLPPPPPNIELLLSDSDSDIQTNFDDENELTAEDSINVSLSDDVEFISEAPARSALLFKDMPDNVPKEGPWTKEAYLLFAWHPPPKYPKIKSEIP